MPIHSLAPRLRELVRFRMGTKEPNTKGDGTRPKALETWRFTSPSKAAIERLAEAYGGTVEEWVDESAPGQSWQVITEASSVSAYIPPIDGFSQWYERWSGGGCQRRCDGRRDMVNNEACDCPEDVDERVALAAKGKACKPVTRLTFVLPELGEVAGGRLESHGYNAAVELAGVEHLYRLAQDRGTFLPVEVRLVERTKKVPGQATRHFVVPEVAVATTVALGALQAGPGGALALPPAREAETDAAGMPPAQVPDHNDPQPDIALTGEEITTEVLLKRFDKLGLEDGIPEDIVRFMTAGRSANLDHLGARERRGLYEVQNYMHEGLLHFLPTGWIDDEEAPVDVTFDRGGMIAVAPAGAVPPADKWKQAARSTPGVSLGALLRQAQAIAAELGAPAPSRVEELQDPELCRRLAAWLDEKAGAAA